jgi:putative ABC transport system permease protein
MQIFVRGGLDDAVVERAVREQVQSVNSALPVFGAETLEESISASLTVRRFSMDLLGLFALTALLLAGIGIYGVTSQMVAERSREFGIRLALGAGRDDVMRMVMRQGLALALVGSAVGLLGALAVSRAIAGLLVGVGQTDIVTLGAAMALLTAAALAGCFVPMHRALRVDPAVALR